MDQLRLCPSCAALAQPCQDCGGFICIDCSYRSEWRSGVCQTCQRKRDIAEADAIIARKWGPEALVSRREEQEQ